MSDSVLVHYEVKGKVALLTLDDPPANTYTHEMMRQLDDAIVKARFDENVEVIVMTGAVMSTTVRSWVQLSMATLPQWSSETAKKVRIIS